MKSPLPIAILLGLTVGHVFGQVSEEFENAPIRYSETAPTDPVTELKRGLASGEERLDATDERAFVRSLLGRLGVPVATQTLVYSKTSLQRDRIHPARPRAIYFSDDYYVGWVRGGNMELISFDQNLGPIFYLIDVPRTPEAQPKIERSQECLSCHASGATGLNPGMMVRSVHTDSGGFPLLAAGGSITDHSSPIAERWGGWYVTGKTGGPRHMGNIFHREGANGRVEIERDLGPNPRLAEAIDVGAYPHPESDVVALMVLEHQCAMHNLFTGAAFATRQALYRQAELAKILGEPTDGMSDSTRRLIDGQVEKVLRQMLFRDEVVLSGGVEGGEAFQAAFAGQARRARDGRSLRDFQLLHRLFKHRCSYMIYSRSFQALPAPFKEALYRRLWEVLSGKDTSEDYAYLSPSERSRILSILRDTKDDLPAYWKS